MYMPRVKKVKIQVVVVKSKEVKRETKKETKKDEMPIIKQSNKKITASFN